MTIGNPWNIQTLYELQFFNCPSCEFKSHSKQKFVDHAYKSHPDSINILLNISDESITDIVCPWKIIDTKKETSNTELIEDPLKIAKEFEPSYNKNSKKCIYPYCNHNGTSKMFNFPVMKARKLWLDACQLESANSNQKVCYKHFNERDIFLSKGGRHLLRPGAIPKSLVSKPFFLSKTDDFINEVEVDNSSTQSQIMKCDICSKKFNSSVDLKEHISLVHKILISHANKEKKEEHIEHPYSKMCMICSTLNITISSLEKDKRFFQNQLHYWKRKFHAVNQRLHKLKIRIREGVKKSKCDICCKLFKASYLKRHIETVHEGVRNSHCDKCGKLFTSSQILKNHIKSVHEGIKDHFCHICDFKTSLISSLKYHISIVHEGVKKHKCEICGKAFGYSDQCKQHIKRVHDKIKDNDCNFCEKSFAVASELKTHVKAVHQGVKNHKCGICKKRFAESKNLKSHVKSVHEGIKDYKCNYCGKSFAHAGNFKKHIKAYHEGVKD